MSARERAAARSRRNWMIHFTDNYTGFEEYYGPYLKAEAEPLARRIQAANEPDEHGLGGATVGALPVQPYPEAELPGAVPRPRAVSARPFRLAFSENGILYDPVSYPLGSRETADKRLDEILADPRSKVGGGWYLILERGRIVRSVGVGREAGKEIPTYTRTS